MSMGDRIKRLLEEQGVTQGELARRVGVTQPAIAHLISGRSVGSSHIHKIARALRTTPAYLTGETDDPAHDAPPPPPPPVLTVNIPIPLGTEEALTAMFVGLLAGLDPQAPQLESARLLARKLPIALSGLQNLRVVSEMRRDHREGPAEAAADLATASHEHQP